MEAGVPFALLAGVQLLSLAAAAGLLLAALLTRRRTPNALLGVGAVLLAAAHGITGAQLGSGSSDPLAWLRMAGYLCLAVGLGLGDLPDLAAVAPIGATIQPMAAAAVAAGLSAVAALRGRGPWRWLLAAGLALAAAAEACAAAARTSSSAAVALLVLRGASALALLAYAGRVVGRSVLSKVVAAILAGVMLFAIGTATVVGTVLTNSLRRDQQKALAATASSQVNLLTDEVTNRLTAARLITACPRVTLRLCAAAVLSTDTLPGHFYLRVTSATGVGVPVPDASAKAVLDDTAIQALALSPEVHTVLNDVRPERDLATLIVLPRGKGKAPVLTALGIAAYTTPRGHKPPDVFTYGVVLGDDRMATIKNSTTFDATVLVDGRAVATTLDTRARRDTELQQIRQDYASRHVDERLRADPTLTGITSTAEGARPTARFVPLTNGAGQQIATLVLSTPSRLVLATQRRLLQTLFLAIVAIALLVGAVAVVLARRIVQPIRELTDVAGRVRAGDLTVTSHIGSRDEVGELSRQFNAMTLSLSAMTDELRQAAADESALRVRLETVLDSIGDGLVIVDASGRVTGVNPAAADLLGVDQSSALGRPAGDVVDGVDAQSGESLAAPARTERTRAGILQLADGRGLPVVAVVAPLRGGGGSVIVLRDTTREREIERMKTEFLSNVSHELRTPLTPIRGYAEILRRHPNLGPEKTTTFAESILDSTTRMARVVDLLVDVAAIEAGRVQSDPETVDIGRFVDQRLAAWRVRAPGREFRRRIAAGVPKAYTDATWAAKALDEMIDNAVKYSEGPVVLVASATLEGRVRVSVRDAGAGIAPDRMDTLFSDFAQGDASATRAVGGLGLGLSFVRRVADVFDLRVSVESTPGKGTTFSLDLPAAPRVRVPRPRRPGAAKSGARRR